MYRKRSPIKRALKPRLDNGKWVNKIVANDILRFCFWASLDNADLMGEDRNNIIDQDSNNAEWIHVQ